MTDGEGATRPPRDAPPRGFALWTEEEVRRVGDEVLGLLGRYLSELPGRPVQPALPADVLGPRDTPAPQAPSSAGAVLQDFARGVLPYPFGNGHPGFFGWVNPPPDVMGVFAELLAAMMNPSCAGGQHAAIEVERQVVGWMRSLFGFPQESMGLFVSGGSMATLTALGVARAVKAGYDVRDAGVQAGGPTLCAYVGKETHTCATKALELLGIGRRNVRTIDSRPEGHMDADELSRAIEHDLALGRRPFCVVASAGTASTGTIDPLDDIADVAQARDLWFHVDGSYGAPAILAPSYAEALSGIRRADSLALDPHKWFCAPVDAGFVLCRNGRAMRDTFHLVPAYIREESPDEEAPFWFSEWGFEQTRAFRALKVWMIWKHRGTEGLREAIAGDIVLAQHLAQLLRADPCFEVWEPQSLSIVCFRHVQGSGSPEEIDDRNRAILRVLQGAGQVFPTSTSIGGRFWLRACIINPWTTRREVEELVQEARTAGGRLS